MTIKKRYVYDHGLPFTEKLKENIDDQKLRIKGNKASMIVIDGQVGEGKTTIAVEVADVIEGERIDLREQLALGGGDFTRKLKLCYGKKKKVIIYDEAGDFNKRGALTKFNAMINRVFETFRAYNIVVILCLPSLYSLDSTLFDKGVIRLCLHVHGRSDTVGHYKGYSLYRSFYLRENMRKNVVKPFAYQQVHPNFYGHFLDLEPGRCRELDKISTKGKMDILDEGEIIYEGLLSMKDMMVSCDRSSIWVRKKLSSLGIMPKKIFKQVNYYEPWALERISALVVNAKKKREEKGGQHDD